MDEHKEAGQPRQRLSDFQSLVSDVLSKEGSLPPSKVLRQLMRKILDKNRPASHHILAVQTIADLMEIAPKRMAKDVIRIVLPFFSTILAESETHSSTNMFLRAKIAKCLHRWQNMRELQEYTEFRTTTTTRELEASEMFLLNDSDDFADSHDEEDLAAFFRQLSALSWISSLANFEELLQQSISETLKRFMDTATSLSSELLTDSFPTAKAQLERFQKDISQMTAHKQPSNRSKDEEEVRSVLAEYFQEPPREQQMNNEAAAEAYQEDSATFKTSQTSDQQHHSHSLQTENINTNYLFKSVNLKNSSVRENGETNSLLWNSIYKSDIHSNGMSRLRSAVSEQSDICELLAANRILKRNIECLRSDLSQLNRKQFSQLPPPQSVVEFEHNQTTTHTYFQPSFSQLDGDVSAVSQTSKKEMIISTQLMQLQEVKRENDIIHRDLSHNAASLMQLKQQIQQLSQQVNATTNPLNSKVLAHPKYREQMRIHDQLLQELNAVKSAQRSRKSQQPIFAPLNSLERSLTRSTERVNTQPRSAQQSIFNTRTRSHHQQQPSNSTLKSYEVQQQAKVVRSSQPIFSDSRSRERMDGKQLLSSSVQPQQTKQQPFHLTRTEGAATANGRRTTSAYDELFQSQEKEQLNLATSSRKIFENMKEMKDVEEISSVILNDRRDEIETIHEISHINESNAESVKEILNPLQSRGFISGGVTPLYNRKNQSRTQLLNNFSESMKEGEVYTPNFDMFRAIVSAVHKIDKFKAACIKEKQQLHEDQALQIGIITDYQPHSETPSSSSFGEFHISLFLSNRSQKVLRNVKVTFMEDRYRRSAEFETTVRPEVLDIEPGKQVLQEITVRFHTFPFAASFISVRYSGSSPLYLGLPTTVNKMVQCRQTTAEDFRKEFQSRRHLITSHVEQCQKKFSKQPEEVMALLPQMIDLTADGAEFDNATPCKFQAGASFEVQIQERKKEKQMNNNIATSANDFHLRVLCNANNSVDLHIAFADSAQLEPARFILSTLAFLLSQHSR